MHLRLVLLASLALPTPAHAANRDTFPLGNQAAMTAGAVTATVTDGGALFYNPAGIASHRRQRFSVNGSATMLVIRPRDEVFTHNIDSDDSTATTDVQLVSAPTAGTFSVPIAPNFSLSAGSFVRVRDNGSQDVQVLGTVEGTDLPALATVDLTAYQDELLFAAGLGWQPTSWLRIGGALYASIGSEEKVGRTVISVGDVMTLNGQSATNPDGRGGGVLNEEIEESTTDVGLEGGIGIQLHPVGGLRLGLMVRTHRVRLYEGGERRQTRTRFWGPPGEGENPQPPEFEVSEVEGNGLGFKLAQAPRIAFGVGYEGRSWSLAGDVDYTFGLAVGNQEFRAHQNPIVNVRVGGTIRVNEATWIGVGGFTDLTGREPAETVLDDHLDWFGGNAGLWLRSPVSLRPDERAEDIVFSSVFALRYAAGVGGVGQMDVVVGPVGDDFESHSVRAVPAVFHEIALHIGSSLEF